MDALLDLELRRSPRVSLFQEIVCEGAEASAHSQAADIGVGGMFIDHASPPFAARELVTVRVSLVPGEHPIVVEAAVNYIQEGIGMGIRFLRHASSLGVGRWRYKARGASGSVHTHI